MERLPKAAGGAGFGRGVMPTGMWLDLLNIALGRVDWFAIAKALRED